MTPHILQFAKKLRAAATAIEALYAEMPVAETSEVATQIRKAMKHKRKKHAHLIERLADAPRKKAHHNGLHWTQRKENKAKLRRMTLKGVKTRAASHAR